MILILLAGVGRILILNTLTCIKQPCLERSVAQPSSDNAVAAMALVTILAFAGVLCVMEKTCV